MHIYL